MYEIRIAHETDFKPLVQFIDQHWKKNHIFVTTKELLDWQHLNKVHERYNFILGINRQTKEIHGILGFIPLSQFDPEIEIQRLCWMAIWKVRDVARGHKLGRSLLSYLEEFIKPDILSTVAASQETLSIYRTRGYQTGRMKHHFILNPYKSSFNLVVAKCSIQTSTTVGNFSIDKRLVKASEKDILFCTAECFALQNDVPIKSQNYLISRYFRHPIYNYETYCISDGTKTFGIIVTRVCSHNGSRAIRIVDFIGPSDALRGMQNQWFDLLKKIDAEYIDFYSVGINENDLLSSGFTRREGNNDIVIPNYYEPFSKENVEIDYMIKVAAGKNYRIVKGDSDQDRPNFVNGVLS